MKKFSFKPVYHTALCLIPDEKQWGQIQGIRKEHDKAYERWMPHINFLFPFYDREHFKRVGDELERNLKEIKPFELTFKEFGHFSHSTKCVLFLKPSEDATLQKVFKIVADACPNLVKRKDFHPHLTLGQFPHSKIEEVKRKYKDGFKEIKFTCSGLNMIFREGKTSPFKKIRDVQFSSTGVRDAEKKLFEGIKKVNVESVEEKIVEKEMTREEKIKSQISFYFSDKNMSKDKWIRERIEKSDNRWLPISMILGFSKMTELKCTNKEFINHIDSGKLELNKLKNLVRRKVKYINYGRDEYKRLTVFLGSFPHGVSESICTKWIMERIKGLASIRPRTNTGARKFEKFIGSYYLTFRSSESQRLFFTSTCEKGNRLLFRRKMGKDREILALPVLVYNKRRKKKVELTNNFFLERPISVNSTGGGAGRGRGRGGRKRSGGRERGRGRGGRLVPVPAIAPKEKLKSKRKSKYEKKYNKGRDIVEYDPIYGEWK